ncbi:MAG: diguanylate cyclase (GGDEF)-like protein [Ilumatobacter sp.]|jgi:diguanylate cyclase (GGDEF)-like protein
MQRGLKRVAWAYVATGLLAAFAAPFLNSTGRAGLTLVVMAFFLPPCVVAHKQHGFPGWFIASALSIGGLYLLSAVLLEMSASSTMELVASAIDLIANGIIIALLAWGVSQRRGRFTTGDILDGLIMGLGGWLIAWIMLVQPYLDMSGRSNVNLVLNAAYLPMATPLIALAGGLVLSGLARRPATWLFVTAVVANVGGDALYATFEIGIASAWSETLAGSLYLIAFASSGAALLHPTSPELIGKVESHRRLKLPSRLTATGLILTIPITLMALVESTSGADRLVRGCSVLSLLILVSLRLAQATRSHLEAQDELIASARTDALTKLPNRTAMLELAAQHLDESWSLGTRPSVMLIDIDRFKNTNDSLGHEAGDEALRILACRLGVVADRLGVYLGRPSGDEFLVLDTTSASTGEALAHAEAFHEVFKAPVSLDAGVMFLTASIGVATMPTDRVTEPADLFRHADIAMYRAKDAGRNCLALYHETMQQRLTHRMQIETALHSALDNHEMRLFHQPIVDTTSGRVAGFEALIRWQRSDGTMMSPAEFIPVAEETGIITSLGSWALLEALTQLNTWREDGIVSDSATMSVNVSVRQLSDPAFCDIVEEALNRSGLPAHLLWLEVTETMMIENPDVARNTLQRIRSTGVRIALDDFGTGYSSLSLLQQFPIQRLKIDRAFVSGIADNANDRSLVRSIIAMAGALGLDIVGEGVETVQQLKMLRQLGADKAQGYLISHPVPAEAMRSTIAALESLSQWEAFDDVLGDRPDRPTRIT